MKRRMIVLAVLVAIGPLAWGQELPPADPHEHARAGQPQHIRRFAVPGVNRRYTGYQAGGGALSWRRGDMPTENEGTWGWDYRGWVVQRRVQHWWLHGRRYQGGSGAYKTDGPHLPHLQESGEHHE